MLRYSKRVSNQLENIGIFKKMPAIQLKRLKISMAASHLIFRSLRPKKMYFGPSCTYVLSIFPGRDRPGTEDSDSLSIVRIDQSGLRLRQQEVRERGKRKRAGLKTQAGVRQLRDSVRKARLATASRDRAWSARSADHDLANLSISRSPPRSLSASPFLLWFSSTFVITNATEFLTSAQIFRI